MNQLANIDPSYLSNKNNQVRTNSLNVAEAFDKQHFRLVKKIKTLDCTEDFLTLHFRRVNFKHNGNVYESYEMTKDGFMFLVMSFTGKKAAKIKESYINAFNQMAQQLIEKTEQLPRYQRYLMSIDPDGSHRAEFVPNDSFVSNLSNVHNHILHEARAKTSDLIKIIEACATKIKRKE